MIIAILFALAVFLPWLDYFRNLSAFRRYNYAFMSSCFTAGAMSVIPILLLQAYLPQIFPWSYTGEFVNDMKYTMLQIGFVEEFFKAIFFLFVLFFFRKQLNEPLDYVVGISLAALGFATVENTLYVYNHGLGIVVSRGIISSAGHVMFVAFVGYAAMQRKFIPEEYYLGEILVMFLLAVLFHGTFDYLLFSVSGNLVFFVIFILFFLIAVEMYVTVLNNALNISPTFTYSRFIHSSHLSKRFALLFLAIGLLVIVVSYFQIGAANREFKSVGGSVRLTMFVVSFVGVRISRFKLIKGRWNPIRFRLPFHHDADTGLERSRARWRIRGEATNEVLMAKYFGKECTVGLTSSHNSFLEYPRHAFVEDKTHVIGDIAFYRVRVYDEGRDGSFRYYGLTPRIGENAVWGEIYPVVALMTFDGYSWEQLPDQCIQDLTFVEWVYISEATDA
jgi:RsiW-degrading membrane proteinase PrsW (M82 family)